MAFRYNGCSDNSVKPIHFFKIILERYLHEGKLKIPTAFVKKYAKGLSESVILKPPNGEEWKVNLAKHDGDVWLENGWKEFANYYSLAHGHLLVFRYEIPSCFQVIIFNMSALEINYPFQEVEEKEESNDVEDYQPCKKRKDNGSAEFPLPCKMRRIDEGDEYEGVSNLQTDCKSKKFKGTQGLPTSKPLKLRVPWTTSKSNIALDRAKAFKSNNPFFAVVMHQSYIHSTSNLSLPSDFARQYFDLSKRRGNVVLKVNGRVWHLKYLVRNSGTSIKTELCGGWKAFRNGNNLKEGDVCIFELIDRNEIAFQLFIFQYSDSPACQSSQGTQGLPTSKLPKSKVPPTTSKSNIALYRAKAFKSNNPSFVVVMRQSYTHSTSNLTLPSDFAKQYFDLNKKRGNVILKVKGRVWHLEYLVRNIGTRKRTELSGGWRAFRNGNNLKEHDICIFELIGRNEIAFRVFIFHRSECPECQSSQGVLKQHIQAQKGCIGSTPNYQKKALHNTTIECKGKLKQLTPAEKRTIHPRTRSSSFSNSRPHDVVGEFGSEFPLLRVTISANHIKKGCMVCF